MEEAIGSIILIIIVIALIVGLLSLAFKVLIASFAAIVAGTLAGYLVVITADWVKLRKLSDPATLASVAALRLTSTGLNVELGDAQLQQWAKSHNLNWLSGLASGAIAAWALYLGVGDSQQIDSAVGGNLSSVVHYFAWMTPVVLVVIFGNGAGLNRSRTEKVRKRVEAMAGRVRACLTSAAALDSLEKQVATLVESFNIAWPDKYREALERYIESNATQVLLSAISAEHFFQSLLTLATIDCKRLEHAKSEWDKVWSHYDKLASTLRYAGRPALARELDVFAENLPKLAALLPRRQWHLFSSALANAESELASLELNAREPEPTSPTAQSRSAYEVLGVSPDMTLEEIKIVYHNLAKIYHSDISGPSDNAKKVLERRMQEINDAWGQVRKIHNTHKTTQTEQNARQTQ